MYVIRAILITKNEDVYYLNNILLEKIPRDIISRKRIDPVSNNDQAAINPPEFLNSIITQADNQQLFFSAWGFLITSRSFKPADFKYLIVFF